MDISDTLAPNSDQLDAVDLRGNPPRIFTVTKVDVRKASDQPVSIHLAEFPRVWRPGKSMRRVLAYCWGNDSAQWVGRQVELYCDDRVAFGGEKIGGTRVSRLSHIDGPKSVPLIIARGKSGVWKVEPLPAGPPAITDEQAAEFATAITTAEDRAALTTISAQLKAFDLGQHKDHLLGLGKARMAELAQDVEGTK